MPSLPFTDDFSGPEIGKDWSTNRASIVSGRLRIDAVANAYDGFAALPPFTPIRDTMWTARLFAPGDTTGQAWWFQVEIEDPSDLLAFVILGNTMELIEVVGGEEVSDSAGYHPDFDKWLRIRIDGTTVKFQSSADGTSWETKGELTTSLDVDDMWGFRVRWGYQSGSPSPAYLEMDDFSAVALSGPEGGQVMAHAGSGFVPATRRVLTPEGWVEA